MRHVFNSIKHRYRWLSADLAFTMALGGIPKCHVDNIVLPDKSSANFAKSDGCESLWTWGSSSNQRPCVLRSRASKHCTTRAPTVICHKYKHAEERLAQIYWGTSLMFNHPMAVISSQRLSSCIIRLKRGANFKLKTLNEKDVCEVFRGPFECVVIVAQFPSRFFQ